MAMLSGSLPCWPAGVLSYYDRIVTLPGACFADAMTKRYSRRAGSAAVERWSLTLL
jgi:hypothetical protein